MELSQEELRNLLHQLNNKACCVLGFFDVIDVSKQPEDVQRILEVLKRNIDEMRKILSKLNKSAFT